MRRQALGMTQEKLATLAAVPQPYVSRIERGEPVHPDDVAAVAKVLGLDPEKLMEEVRA